MGNIKKFMHKLSKHGKYSYYVILPKGIVDELNWRERQRLSIRRSGKKVIIEDWEK